MPRKPKTATNGTALANVEAAAPPARQITRSQANAMLKSRALELYHEARTRREEQIRIFEAEYGRVDRLDHTILADLQRIQARLAAIAARQQRGSSTSGEPKVTKQVEMLGQLLGSVARIACALGTRNRRLVTMATKARATRMLATERLELTLASEDVERARRAAAQNGLTVSAYLGALIRGEPIVPRPAAQLQELALIANRIASALAALAADAAEPRRLLRDANARIAGLLRTELPAYDAAVKAQVAEDTWGAPG